MAAVAAGGANAITPCKANQYLNSNEINVRNLDRHIERITATKPYTDATTLRGALRDIARDGSNFLSLLPAELLEAFSYRLEAAVYVAGTVDIAEVVRVKREFDPVDETDRELHKDVHGDMPKVCPSCLVDPPAFCEATGTIMRLYWCSSCLAKRLANRTILSPRELATRELVDNVRAAHGWVRLQRLHYCWECAVHVDFDRHQKGPGAPRCASNLGPSNRLFCSACYRKYHPDPKVCSFCNTKATDLVILPDLGRRICCECVREVLSGRFSRQECRRFAEERIKAVKECAQHGEKYIGKRCRSCEYWDRAMNKATKKIEKANKRAACEARKQAEKKARDEKQQEEKRVKKQKAARPEK